MQHLQKTGGPALRHSGAQPCARSGHPHPPAPHSYPHGSLSTDHGSPCHIGISPKLPTGKPSNPQTNGQSPPLLHCPPMARQRLGQHFLADLHWREEIARAIRVSPHSTVPLPRDDQHCWIEIGSGHGEMTQHLLAAVPGDILEADIAAIASGRRLRIYGNLPYYITSPILHHLFTFADFIDEIHIVIQTEVALRLAAQPGTRDYGYLSVVTQFYSRPEFVFEIPRDAFNPPPEVTSALVTLRLPGERAKLSLGDASRFLDFVKLCFSKKRKTLVNNLRSLAKPDRVREALASLDLRPDSRAEQLPVAQLAALQALLAGS